MRQILSHFSRLRELAARDYDIPGSRSSRLSEKTIEAEDILLARDDVQLVQSTIPGEADTGAQALQAAFSGRASNSAVITVRLEEEADLEASRDQIKEDLAPISTDGFDVAVSEQDAFGGGSALQIVVSGNDPVEIEQAASAIAAELEMVQAGIRAMALGSEPAVDLEDEGPLPPTGAVDDDLVIARRKRALEKVETALDTTPISVGAPPAVELASSRKPCPFQSRPRVASQRRKNCPSAEISTLRHSNH